MANIKFFTGAKADIDAKVTEGVIDEGDIILTSDTDELVFINPQKEKKIISTKSQKQYELKNGNLGSLKAGDVLDEGISFDDFLERVTGEAGETTSAALTFERIGGDAAGEYAVGSAIDVSLKATLAKDEASTFEKCEVLVNGEPVSEVTKLETDGTIDLETSFVMEDNIDYVVEVKAVVDGKEVYAKDRLVYSSVLFVYNNYFEEMPDLNTLDFSEGGDVVDHGTDSAYPFISEGYKVSVLAVKSPYEFEAILHHTAREDITDLYTIQTIGDYQVAVYEMATKTPVSISLRTVIYKNIDEEEEGEA